MVSGVLSFFRRCFLPAHGIAGRIALASFIATGIATATFCASAAVAASPLDGDVSADEYAIKAAYIYSILKFVRWPAPQDAEGEMPFIDLCIYGDNPFSVTVLDGLESKPVQGYRLRISRIAMARAENARCHAVFIAVDDGADDYTARQLAIAAFQRKGLLTLGDSAGFAKAGGIVEFVSAKNKIRFDLNLTKAQAQGVTLSSQLADAAREVF